MYYAWLLCRLPVGLYSSKSLILFLLKVAFPSTDNHDNGAQPAVSSATHTVRILDVGGQRLADVTQLSGLSQLVCHNPYSRSWRLHTSCRPDTDSRTLHRAFSLWEWIVEVVGKVVAALKTVALLRCICLVAILVEADTCLRIEELYFSLMFSSWFL